MLFKTFLILRACTSYQSTELVKMNDDVDELF